MSGEDEPPEEGGAEAVLLHFFRESTLWPVTIVVVLAFVSFGGTILAFAVQRRSPFAWVAIGALLLASFRLVDPDLRERRLGAVSILVGGLWLGCAAAAAAFIGLGVY